MSINSLRSEWDFETKIRGFATTTTRLISTIMTGQICSVYLNMNDKSLLNAFTQTIIFVLFLMYLWALSIPQIKYCKQQCGY